MKKIDIPILFIFLLILSSPLVAQTSGDLKVSRPAPERILVSFVAEKELGSLLVIVSDSLGSTLFMDSQIRFKGPYKWDIDLSSQPKGRYQLEVIRDEEHYNSTVTLK